ncbi:MAG: hypothetical protein Q4F27_04395 [Desulfovibrionaceae bacterium]|nr:hypothetical protein [Desulfovibrionaceae bacterium]
MIKRLADWLEKMSVAALAVGIFQQKMEGVVIAVLAFGWCIWLTKRMEKK